MGENTAKLGFSSKNRDEVTPPHPGNMCAFTKLWLSLQPCDSLRATERKEISLDGSNDSD